MLVLVESMEKPGKNLTWTSDIVPIEEQIALLVSIGFLKAKTSRNIFYNQAERKIQRFNSTLVRKSLSKKRE